MHIYDIVLKSSWYEKLIRENSTENQNTILCSKNFFFFEKNVPFVRQCGNKSGSSKQITAEKNNVKQKRLNFHAGLLRQN